MEGQVTEKEREEEENLDLQDKVSNLKASMDVERRSTAVEKHAH